jgi:prepilin-type N-terminal cleavage/methylation domain-containing protein
MRKVYPKLNSQSGVSLVELLVVIIIIAVVASLAILGRGSANEQFQRQNAAAEVKIFLERARFDSVKRRADGSSESPFAFVEIYPTSVTLTTYNKVVGSAATASTATYNFPTGVTAEALGYSLGSSKQVRFDRRGLASVVGGGQTNFMVCRGSCPSSDNATADANTLVVTATGTVNMLNGRVAPPAFDPPTGLDTVPTTDGIKDEAIL